MPIWSVSYRLMCVWLGAGAFGALSVAPTGWFVPVCKPLAKACSTPRGAATAFLPQHAALRASREAGCVSVKRVSAMDKYAHCEHDGGTAQHRTVL
jgi:hypothetical protein